MNRNPFAQLTTEKKTEKVAVKVDTTIANSDVVQKYKLAGEITMRVLAQVKELTIAGATTFDITTKGDALLTEELSKIYNSKKTSKISKGIAFPTTVNPNQIPAHLAPISEKDDANITLKDGDVVNIMLGVQIDGYPSIVGETLIIGASTESPITGKKADLINATWLASEASIRSLRPNGKNWDITSVVEKISKSFDVTPVESMLSHNIIQNVLYGPKEIILNPTKQNKSEMSTYKFEENEVYGLDILLSTSKDGKVKPSNFRTSIYKLTGNSYQLKMKMSHKVLAEFKSKSNGNYPVNIRNLEEPSKARGGLVEPSSHKVILPYDVVTEKEGEFVAQYFTTVAITKNGIVKYTNPSFNKDLYKTDKQVEDEGVLKVLSQPLKTKK